MTDTRPRLAEPRAGAAGALALARRAVFPAAAVAIGVGAVWAGAGLGGWYLPFAAGLLTAVPVRWRAGRPWPALTIACLIGMGGWALSLLWLTARGQPVGATARAVAALAGLPPYAAVTIAATLFVAALQAAAGYCVGWSVAALIRPRP